MQLTIPTDTALREHLMSSALQMHELSIREVQSFLLSSSLFLLIEPNHPDIDQTDPSMFWKSDPTSMAATTTFWSEDLRRLHDAISEKDWKVLVEDWKELHPMFRKLLAAYKLKIREPFGIFKVDIYQSVSVRLEILRVYQTFMGESRSYENSSWPSLIKRFFLKKHYASYEIDILIGKHGCSVFLISRKR